MTDKDLWTAIGNIEKWLAEKPDEQTERRLKILRSQIRKGIYDHEKVCA